MNGVELDKQTRKILAAATRQNIVHSVSELVRLGFGAGVSAELVVKVIEQKEKQT